MSQPPAGPPPQGPEPPPGDGAQPPARGGFASCVRSMRYSGQVRQASAAAIGSGIVGTPTVKVNGTAPAANETLTAEGLRNAVTTAG